MANNNFVELVRATVQTLEGNEPKTQVYTEQCKAMVHGFVQVRNSLPTLLEAADGVCSALIFKELYCLASEAVRILKLCCCEEQTWLQAVILLKVHTRNGPKWSTFETLRDELDWCINILRGNIHVDRLTHRDRERYDEENLRQKLRNAVKSGTPQEVSIANFLLARLDVNNGQPLNSNCRCIQQLNCWLPQCQETVPLIHLIEGPAVGPRVIRDGEISSVSSNLTWFGINVAEKAFGNGDDIRIPERIRKRNRKRIRKRWKKEAHIMATLTHPNVVSFIGCSDGNEGPAIIMECEKQSLQDYIDHKLRDAEQTHGHLLTAAETRRRATPLLVPLVTVVHLLTQIASGMAYLHSQDIAHLDLKLANLLITSHTNYEFLHVKIADFGESIRLKGRSGKIRNRWGAKIGTTVFRAPELFRKGRRVCFYAADVCSFGFTAWAILHCHEPRLEILHDRGEEEEPEVEIVSLSPPFYYNALVAGNRLGFHDTIPEELQVLINRCWDTDPDTRPAFSQIYYYLQSFKAKLLGSHVDLVPL